MVNFLFYWLITNHFGQFSIHIKVYLNCQLLGFCDGLSFYLPMFMKFPTSQANKLTMPMPCHVYYYLMLPQVTHGYHVSQSMPVSSKNYCLFGTLHLRLRTPKFYQPYQVMVMKGGLNRTKSIKELCIGILIT